MLFFLLYFYSWVSQVEEVDGWGCVCEFWVLHISIGRGIPHTRIGVGIEWDLRLLLGRRMRCLGFGLSGAWSGLRLVLVRIGVEEL